MIYFFAVSIFFVVIAVLIIRSKKKSQQRLLKNIRQQWGCPKKQNINIDHLSIYKELNLKDSFHTLSCQTLNDIDFYELFLFIDRTNSRVGQQYLYDLITKPTNNLDQLKSLDNQISFFQNNQAVRELIQCKLHQLNDADSSQIATLLKGEIFQKPKWYPLIVLSSLTILLLILLSLKYQVCLLFLLPLLFINSLIHLWNKNNLFQFIRAFPQLSKLISVANNISSLEIPFEKDELIKSIIAFRPFQLKLRLLGFSKPRIADDLAALLFYLVEVFKSAFLIEIHIFFNIVNLIKSKREHLIVLFEFIGLIDSCISVASLRESGLNTCKPHFIPASKQMHISKMVHPLIFDCVENSLSLNAKSGLITGSNMAGKSTFLRTICINNILAQTIFTCFAEAYQVPFMRLYSSIRIDDNLLSGSSYFFEEANLLRELLAASEEKEQSLFVLDEIFRGTNTLERVAAAKSVLEYLNRNNNIVIAATHDLELAELQKNEFNVFHFTEFIEDAKLCFDYKLKKGVLKTRNAIKILELLKFPPIITETALTAISSKSKDMKYDTLSNV